MRLLIATGLYPPDIGGPATYTKFLERHLPKYEVDFTVVAFTHVRKYPRIMRHALYLARLLRAGKDADIIYALDTVSVGVPALIASVLLRKKLYLRVPGDYAWEQGQQRFGISETLDEYLKGKDVPYPVRFLAWLQYRVARYASCIIVPSEYMKGVVHGWGIPHEKIHRVYSALKTITVSESREALRIEFRYTGFVIATAGRLVPWKGYHALIDVISSLKDKGVPVILEIFGDGVCRKELEEKVQKKGLTAHVRFFGNLERDSLGKRLKSADVFVLNTSYEGLSHQLIEVMSLGTPIVTTPVGGNVELITHEETGLLTPFNDTEAMEKAILRIYEDSAYGASLAQRAQVRTALFHEDISIKSFIAVLTGDKESIVVR